MTAPSVTESRELLAVREIAHAYLVAERPGEVQQFALDRVTPLLGASFSLVMELGADGELLRPVAQHEWPSKHRHWIGALRVRVGDGPSGVAVAERRLVEVPDLFADAALEVWHEVAEELAFRSILAAPLETAEGPIGAIAFYFADATSLTDEQRTLVRVVADQLAAATDKARRTDALRRANAALAEANHELGEQARAWARAEQQRDEVESRVVDAMLALTAPHETPESHATLGRLEAAHALAQASHEFTVVTRAGFSPGDDDVDPREPLREAVGRWRQRMPGAVIQVDEPTVLLPTIRASQAWLTRAIELALGLALRTADAASLVRTSVELGRGFLALQVRWEARPEPVTDTGLDHAPVHADILERVGRGDHHEGPAACRLVTAVDLPLLKALVGRLGGDVRLELPPAGDDRAHAIVLLFPIAMRT